MKYPINVRSTLLCIIIVFIVLTLSKENPVVLNCNLSKHYKLRKIYIGKRITVKRKIARQLREGAKTEARNVEGAWTAVASPNTIKMKQVNSKRT
jgi:hypothetical protein